jgi:hypothetical protein
LVSPRGGDNKSSQEINRETKDAEEKVSPRPQDQAEAGTADNRKNTEKYPPYGANTEGKPQIPGESQQEKLGIIGKILPGTGGVEKKGKKAESKEKKDRYFGKEKKKFLFLRDFHSHFLRFFTGP